MAKVKCSIDTTEKSIEVEVDGKKVDNFGYMSIYGANSPYGYMFSMASIEEMEDCTKTTYWSHSKQAKDIDNFLRNIGKEKATEDMDKDDKPVDSDPKKKKGKKMMYTEDKKKC